MPITSNLGDNGRIFHVVMVDPWERADLIPLTSQIRTHVSCASRPIHTLIDVRQVRRVPSRIVQESRNLLALDHPNCGEFVIVGATKAQQILATLAFRIARSDKVTFVETEDEAWTYLRGLIASEGIARRVT
jgi:hypothetical protein